MSSIYATTYCSLSICNLFNILTSIGRRVSENEGNVKKNKKIGKALVSRNLRQAAAPIAYCTAAVEYSRRPDANNEYTNDS